ncbi:MAG: hypothetical protein HQK81_12435 [Desulfovibrionaceae bacterium]|nr:hypothetical protein [Desulfovibrionaceae bacterium]MBF0514851.1 hypothetical protein [Desulfovibrionaceae bacterium]
MMDDSGKSAFPGEPEAAPGERGAGPSAQLARLREEHRELTVLFRKTRGAVEAKKGRLRELSQYAQTLREKLVKHRAKEQFLGEEIAFLDRELAGKEKTLAASETRLTAHLAEIEKTARQIEFFKGEVQTLEHLAESLRGQVPEKVSGASHLDDKIAGTAREFVSLAERIKHADKDFKLSYYQKKRELRRKHARY